MHGDLTCSNILLNAEQCNAKIGDLGLSRRLNTNVPETDEDSYGGTLPFASPEALVNKPCNEKVTHCPQASNASTLIACFTGLYALAMACLIAPGLQSL